MIHLSNFEIQEILEKIFGESQIGQIPRSHVLKAINLTQKKLLEKQVKTTKYREKEGV